MKTILSFLLATLFALPANARAMESIQKYGVLPTNSAAENTKNLQKAIDAMSPIGGGLYVEPVEGGYPLDGGIYLGSETYGQLTNFNLDCVSIGIYKTGSNTKNRNWQISQGSIIANVAEDGNQDLVHPIVIDGIGHTALANVEAFSGQNPALTTCGTSRDFLYIKGNHPLTVSMTGCRMQGYTATNPILQENPNAKLRAVACVDKDGNFFDR